MQASVCDDRTHVRAAPCGACRVYQRSRDRHPARSDGIVGLWLQRQGQDIGVLLAPHLKLERHTQVSVALMHGFPGAKNRPVATLGQRRDVVLWRIGDRGRSHRLGPNPRAS